MKTLFAVAITVFTFSGLASAQAWNHNPASSIGPLHWGTVTPSFATCGDSSTGAVGMMQSPIDIVPGNAVAALFAPPLLNYKQTPLKIENTGHYIEVPYDPNSYLYVGLQPTDAYLLAQFHFHAPSEHTLNGVRYDAELHLVHTNAIGETAVIGVLLSSSAAGLPIFDTIMANSPLSPGEIELSEEVNVSDLLPAARGFYRYAGSLTTPACTEGVQWFLLKNPVPITPRALAKLHALIALFPNYGGYSNNNRPVANLNNRTVLKTIDFNPWP
ncbi:MAG: carbonic anhydrase family protein [Bryobacteraceae bacterium]|jgi:carbonic anhydrase